MNAFETTLSNQYVLSSDPESVLREFAEVLKELGLTVSVAESCSGGLLSAMLTDFSGSSAYFHAGVVAYSNAAKTALIGVPTDLIEQHGAVSAEVAEAMAAGVRRITGSDLALSVTGIAGPTGGTTEKPVGTVYLGLAGSDGCRSRLLTLAGTRGEIRTQSVLHAVGWLGRDLSRRRKLAAGSAS